MTPVQSPVSKHRLEALSDGIYAIALTLLVLELKLPALPRPVTDSLLVEALRALVPKALTWLLSFCIIALFWLAQQRLFRLASSLSPRLSSIELLHLSLISLFPFSTALLGEHARHKPVQQFTRLIYFSSHSFRGGGSHTSSATLNQLRHVGDSCTLAESESLAAHRLLLGHALFGVRRPRFEYARYAANSSYAESWRR